MELSAGLCPRVGVGESRNEERKDRLEVTPLMKSAIPLVTAFIISFIGCLGADVPLDGKADTYARSAAIAKKERSYLETKGERKLDITYKAVGKRKLGIDIYYPENRVSENLPTLIYTHGGGWSAGSKQNISKGAHAQAALKLLEAGFCVVSVDYRLCHQGGRVMMRDCVIDSKDAVRYLAKHSGALGLDPQRFFVLGDSAGGQIAQMLLLTKPDSLPGALELKDASYRMVAGVSYYGPCDFEKVDLFNHDNRADFRDRFGPRILSPETDPADKLNLYREVSPIQYLTKDSPPLLMIQGDQDTTIPVKHAYYMKEKASAERAPVEIMIVKNAGHNWRRVGAPVEPTVDEIVQRTVSFLSEHRNAVR